MNVRRSVALEIAGIALLTLVFLTTFQERPSYVDLSLAGVAVALIVASTPRSRSLWQAVPSRSRAEVSELRRAWLAAAAFTAGALALLAVIALLAMPAELRTGDQLVARFFSWHLLLAMLLYFPWALLQQYIFQFYLFGRLLQLLPVPAAVALTAVAFASVHFPRWPVMAVTVIAGSVWTLLYHRYRALLPLAASHAILGAALHYWVFGRDLLARWWVF